MASHQQKVCRKAGRRNNNRQLYYYQLISGLTEFYLTFIVNFNISNFNRLQLPGRHSNNSSPAASLERYVPFEQAVSSAIKTTG
jgi:hypothetical protein